MVPQEIQDLVNRVALGRLHKYVALLGKWRNITNLIAEESFANIWERHILDSLYLHRQEPYAKSWLDIGSGAGLPGVVIASMLADYPGAQVHCVEIDRRKCAFLREVASQLEIPMKIHNVLSEGLRPLDFPQIRVVTARAFSSLARIVDIADPFLSEGAIVVLPRGRNARAEVAALNDGRYRIDVATNPTPGDGVFVRIKLRDCPINER